MGGLGSGLDMREVEGSLGGGWGVLVCMVCFIRKGLRLGFGIWAGIPLLWAMAPVRALVGGDDGRFGVGFEYWGRLPCFGPFLP